MIPHRCFALVKKTKLLVVSTKELRDRKLTLHRTELTVNVCGSEIQESDHKKLLGMIVQNDLKFKTYLNGNTRKGDETITGLLSKLNKRVGILKQLAKVLSPNQLKSASHGIFNSTLIYCLQLFGKVWIEDNTHYRYSAFTKSDSNKLQVLQNKVLRLRIRTGLHPRIPTKDFSEYVPRTFCKPAGCLMMNILGYSSMQMVFFVKFIYSLNKCKKPSMVLLVNMVQKDNSTVWRFRVLFKHNYQGRFLL